jgi:hypothetical protein
MDQLTRASKLVFDGDDIMLRMQNLSPLGMRNSLCSKQNTLMHRVLGFGQGLNI